MVNKLKLKTNEKAPRLMEKLLGKTQTVPPRGAHVPFEGLTYRKHLTQLSEVSLSFPLKGRVNNGN